MGDPTRQFACMKAGAEAGLAPAVLYTNLEERISITDFVEARPFPLADARVRLPIALRHLHALPPFPRATNYLGTMDEFVTKFQASKILPECESENLFQAYSSVRSIYPYDDSETVSCHNDLKPENILFDGDRVWLVDWEAAFLNDRYADLAVIANFVLTNEAEEEILLRTYFGKSPSEYQLARFYLMRQIMHMFYAAVFLLLGSSGKPLAASFQAPDFRDFHNRIWAREISLANAEAKLQYGKVHADQLAENAHSPRFQEALRIFTDL